MSLHDNRATGQHLVVVSRRAGPDWNSAASGPTNRLLRSLKKAKGKHHTGEQERTMGGQLVRISFIPLVRSLSPHSHGFFVVVVFHLILLHARVSL